MSDFLTQLELADPRSRETQWVEKMARSILERPRYKGKTVCWSSKMPDYLHARLFGEADRHGLTLTDMANYILEQSLKVLEHSEPMKGKVVKHVDRRTREGAKRKAENKKRSSGRPHDRADDGGQGSDRTIVVSV